MKLKSIVFLTFMMFGAFLINSNAQSGYGYSYIEATQPNPNGSINIYAESGTVLDYQFNYDYQPGIQPTLFENGYIRDTASLTIASAGYNAISLYTNVPANYNATYRLHAEHYVRAKYYFNTPQGPSFRDYWGLNGYQGNYPTPYSFAIRPTAFYSYHTYRAASTEVEISVTRPLHLSSIDQASGVPTANSFVTTLRGTGLFGNSSSVNVSGSGVTAQINANQLPNTIEVLEISITIEANAPRGERQISLTVNGVASNSLTFTVGDNSPQITNMTPPEANTGETVGVTISGTHFGLNPTLQIGGVGVNATITSSSPTQITAYFSVADATIIGTRGVQVKSRGINGTTFQTTPQTSDLSNSVPFVVFVPQVSITEFDSVEVNGIRNISVSVTNAKSDSVTVFSFGNSQKASFSDGAISKRINGNGNAEYSIKGLKASGQLDDTSIIAFPNRSQGGIIYKTERFTVSSVAFEKATACSGFDPNGNEATDPLLFQPYLFLAQNGNATLNNKVKAKIIPAGASGNFRFESSNGSFTLSSTTISSGEQILTLTGGSQIGEFELRTFGNEAAGSEPASKLKVIIRKRINKTVVIHAITEDNDDVQTLPIGQGEPNHIAIEPSFSTLNTTITRGDDQRIVARNSRGVKSFVITTGADGIRQTPMITGDVEKISMNQGKPNTICVDNGDNNDGDTNVNSTVNGDDDYDNNDNVQAGLNGLCQTTANNTDLVPEESTIPDAVSLQNYLNIITWGKQSNIFLTVIRDTIPRQVNFDLDGNKFFDSFTGILEFQQIDLAFGSLDPNTFDLYYLKTPLTRGNAASYSNFNSTVFSPDSDGTRNYQAAHEIGHLLGRIDESLFVEDLMYSVDSASSPCEIKKKDLDLINLKNPQN